MYDLFVILQKADAVAALFNDPSFCASMAEHCNCGEVDALAALLVATDNEDSAAALIELHHADEDEGEGCPERHPLVEASTALPIPYVLASDQAQYVRV